MKILRASISDKEIVSQLYNEARQYFKEHSINQWQDGYPNGESFLQDAKNRESFILWANGKAAATFMFSMCAEPTYENIFNGNWLYRGKSAVIHRIVVKNELKGNGVFAEIISFTKEAATKGGFAAVRADTHRDNLSMQKALLKNGFQKAGTILLQNGESRIAYECSLLAI